MDNDEVPMPPAETPNTDAAKTEPPLESRHAAASETMGAIINFGDILSVGDPVVNGILESSVSARLAESPHRQFRLTPRVLVLLFDAPAIQNVTDALHKLEAELSTSHCGHLVWKVIDLRHDMAQFRVECRATIDNEQIHPSQASYHAASDQLGALLHIIDALHTVDFAFHLRQQPAVSLNDPRRPSLEFEEWTVSLDELERAMGLPIRDEPWKFQHVTEFLDFKVMDLVARDWKGGHPVALNFHVRNVLQPRFDDATRKIAPEARSALIFELSVSEFLNDRANYVGAAAKLHAAGFRVAADSAVWPVIETITGVFPSVQYVKIPWTDAFARCNDEQKSKIRQLIQTPGLKFVLCRCGSRDNVTVGQQLGFQFFQGWAVSAPPVAQAPVRSAAPAASAEAATAKKGKKS
jgi:EAL domain-containing protein (putative c-di-GMP-specific phosphodiesterase class I)